MRKQIRTMQRAAQRKADKAAAKLMGWPKALRQYANRFGNGAEQALSLSKQVERDSK